MKTELLKYQFLPDSELLNFAKYFSDNYKELNVGEYFSENKKYQIKYLARIRDKSTLKVLNAGAIVSNMTGIIELDKFIFSKGYTSDFLFFIIIWCVACNSQENKGDMKMADKLAVEYYLTTGRSKKNLALGYVSFFSKVLTELNKERYEIITKMLESPIQS